MQAYDANPPALDRSPASWSRLNAAWLCLSIPMPSRSKTQTQTQTRTTNPNGRAHSQVASVTNVSSASSLERRGLSASKNQ